MKLSAMRDFFADRPAAVLGGGPSLPADMQRLPAGCLLIAVNYHAFRLCEPDFMVFNDCPETDADLLKATQETKAVKVSPWEVSDVKFDVQAWTGNNSSHTATWLALWMGCSPVILCGMDLYQGEKTYFYPTEKNSPTFHQPLEHYLRPWKEDGSHLLPHIKRVKVMSGPLVQIFGAYEGQ